MDNENVFEQNQCVICLENIETIPQTFKFPCNHKNFMHTECINHLNNCPLCRINSNGTYVISRNNNINLTSTNYFFYMPHFFILSILLFFFLFIIIQSFYLYVFDNNNNYLNTTNISNITNITNFYYI